MTVICYKIISTMICTEPLMHFVTKSKPLFSTEILKSLQRKNKQEKKGTMCPQAKTQRRGWNWRANSLELTGLAAAKRRSQCRGQGLLCPDGHSSHCSSGTYTGVAESCLGRGRDAERFNSCFPDKPGWKWHVPNPVQHT